MNLILVEQILSLPKREKNPTYFVFIQPKQ